MVCVGAMGGGAAGGMAAGPVDAGRDLPEFFRAGRDLVGHLVQPGPSLAVHQSHGA